MLTTIKPIIVAIDGLTAAVGTYLLYEVRMLYSIDNAGGTASKTLYHGKTFVRSGGTTEIRVDKVLRDYLYRWTAEYNNEAQQHRPSCIVSSFDEQHNAVELACPAFWNTTIEVAYTYNGAEYVRQLEVCGAWSPPYQKMGGIVPALDQSSVFSFVQNYATLATPIPPHIPPVYTANYWLGLVLNINCFAEALVGSIEIGTSSVDNVSLLYGHGGTYAIAITLMQLYQSLTAGGIDGGQADTTDYYDSIDGGDSETVADGEYDGGTAEESDEYNDATIAGANISLYWSTGGTLYSTIAAVVDVCAKPFYVAWMTPTGGWTSYGMDGNVVFNAKHTRTAITNLRDESEVLADKEEAELSLYSGMVDKETYAHLMTMLSSHILYCYDSTRDMGWYCTAVTSSANTLPTNTGKAQAFNIQLKTINNFEQ